MFIEKYMYVFSFDELMKRGLVWTVIIVVLVLIVGCSLPQQRKDVESKQVHPKSVRAIQGLVPKPDNSETRQSSPAGVIKQEIMEKGGTLVSWNQTILQATGPASEESKTLNECNALMGQKIIECSQRPAWSVVNAMEITDFRTNQHYEFQDVKRQDCPGALPTDNPSKVHVDTAFLDAQTDSTRSSSFQVVCSITCNWWECDESVNLTGVWEGTYVEMAGSKYCQFKETGTKTFSITMIDDNSFSGTTKYSGRSTVTGGQHCEGFQSSGIGKIVGSISGDKVSGTLQYKSVAIPFKGKVSKGVISGEYSYTTFEGGSAYSGTGMFSVTKKT